MKEVKSARAAAIVLSALTMVIGLSVLCSVGKAQSAGKDQSVRKAQFAKLSAGVERRLGFEGLGFFIRVRRMNIRQLQFLSRKLSASEKKRVDGLIKKFLGEQAEKEGVYKEVMAEFHKAKTVKDLQALEGRIADLEKWVEAINRRIRPEINKAKVVCISKSRSGKKFCPVIDCHASWGEKEYLKKIGADYCWWTNSDRSRGAEQAKDYPWVVAFFGGRWWGKTPEETEAGIRRTYKKGYRGFGEFKTSHSAPYMWKPSWKTRFDEERFEVIYRTCGELGMPILFHMEIPAADGYPGFILGNLDAYARMLKKYPKTIFIAHSHGIWRYIDSNEPNLPRLPTTPIKGPGRLEEILKKYPNAYVSLDAVSGFIALQRDMDFAKGFLERNYKKIVFGSDYAFSGKSVALDYLETLQVLDLPKEVFEAIVYKNALRLIPADLSKHKPAQ